MENIVQCDKVSKIYRQGELAVYALTEVDLQIATGSFASLCGPSGSGKTTLLNLIGGLDRPTAGVIQVDGCTLGEMNKAELAELRLHHLGFIFQSYNLIPVLSARENVEFVMQLQGIDAAKRKKRSMAIIQEVGLEGMEDRRPGELSGGQQQRVAVARAIVGNPGIVLADEPTANLDSKTARRLLELMLKMNEEREVTFLFSTHDRLVMEYAKRLISLQDGRIVSDEMQ